MEIGAKDRKFLFTLLFGAAFGVASFGVTRGTDGSFVGFVCTFGMLALLYLGYVAVRRSPNTPLYVLGEFLLFEVLACIGMLVDARLEEMAGILYLIIPGGLTLIVACGGCINTARRLVGRRSDARCDASLARYPRERRETGNPYQP